MGETPHVPVMLQEVLEFLQPRPGGIYIDATVGYGSHAAAIGELCGPTGLVVGVDFDKYALEFTRLRLQECGVRFHLLRGNFADLDDLLAPLALPPVDGILYDLGFSSAQVDDVTRGFSFHGEAFLDFRMDPDAALRGADVVNTWAERELTALFRQFGERHGARIAHEIVRNRPIYTTRQLVDIIVRSYPRAARHGRRRNISSKVFLALRNVTNDELANLRRGLPVGLARLAPGRGRLVCLTYNGEEDRIAKVIFRRYAGQRVEESEGPPMDPPWVRILTRKPRLPSREEIRRNRRARSCKLRAVERLPTKGTP